MTQENELLELTGNVDSIIYKNEENGYTVLRMTTDSGEQTTVVGCFPYASAGESMIVSGTWMTHAVHGRQFKAEFAQRLLPTSAEAIYEYLAGGAVRGIGPATAALIVERFGDKTLDVLENDPEQLARIKGISLAKAKEMSKSFRRQTGVRRLMEFVCSFGLRPILAMRMYKFYGENALDMLRNDPYILASEHIGGTFSEADKLALEMGLDGSSPNRIGAAVLFELQHNSGNGHCFIPREKLTAATAQLIDVSPDDVEESIDTLKASFGIVCEEIAGCDACYLPRLHDAESDAASQLARLSLKKYSDSVDIPKLIARLERSQGITYAPLQRKTLELALKNQIVVITGGPGTGKTTTIRALIELFDALGLDTVLTAPTGRAAKRMTELTGREASTVHRLLEAKLGDDGESVIFQKDRDDRLKCDAVILDECSMVDITLLDALLCAMPDEARLVLVGDAQQLPSVGPGNVFADIIRSGVVPTTMLTEIFRQNEGSRIVRNAHMINNGEYPDFADNSGDFFRLRRLQAASTVETITQLCSVRLPQKMNIAPQDIQVLTPTRKGECGTYNLNRQLQAVLNPPSKEKKEKLFGDVTFREGDRVMQIKNNYDIVWQNETKTQMGTGVFNGDIGFITKIDTDAETVTVNFDGRISDYGFDGLIELEHAWAMTVHKSQGSEYKAVILAINAGPAPLMTRSVLYTAVTRARQLLILVGDEQLACRMIDNHRQTRRYSGLCARLRILCGAV